MYGDEHERVTKLAIETLSRSSSEPAVRELLSFIRALVAATSLPDAQPEYERAIIPDEAVFMRSRLVRVPHHTCPSYRILRKLLKVRAALLQSRLGEKEVRELGYALHYLQDRCVPSPKLGSVHSYVERSLHEGLDGFLRDCMLEAVEVMGYGQLSRIVRGQKPSGDPGLAARCALTMTYAALYAVFANPVRAYPELMERAQAFREVLMSWKGSVYAMLAAGGLALNLMLFLRYLNDVLIGCVTLVNVLASYAVAFLLPITLFVFALALHAAFTRSLTTMLRQLHRLTDARCVLFSVAVFTISTLLAPLTLAPLAVGYVLVLVNLLPLLSKNFRAIRAEIPWFKWD